MIFKKRKTGQETVQEPKTKIDPFPGASSEKPLSTKNAPIERAPSIDRRSGIVEEPPTRAAVFDAPVLAIPKADTPQVGLLVIIEGPGRGFTAPLSYGENLIGRSGEAQIRLDFGDAEISENVHAELNYDPETREFHIVPGDKEAVFKVGKTQVKKSRKLKNRDRITMGNTVLMFLAVCGDGFDWRADAPGPED